MSKKIIETIKSEKEIRVRGKVPTELFNLNEILQEVENASTPQELLKASIYTKEVENALKLAKKKLNDAVKKELLLAKEVIDANSGLEKAIKDKFLETIKITKTPKKERNGDIKTDANGEVMFNETTNLPKGVASYTPASSKVVVDKKEIINLAPEAHKQKSIISKLTKTITTYEIDEVALQEYILTNGLKGLPTKTETKEAKISLQGKFLLNKDNQKLLLAPKHELEF